MRTAQAILAEVEDKAAAPSAAPPDIAKVAKPAPGASPVGAFAFLAGDDGTEAWLVKNGDQSVGYLRDTAQPDRAIEIDDPKAWAQIVDQLHLTEQAVPTTDAAATADQTPPAAPQAPADAAPPAAPADRQAPAPPAGGSGSLFDGQGQPQTPPTKTQAPTKPATQGKAATVGGVATPADYEEQTGIMVAFCVPEGDAADLVIDHPTALPAGQLHVTLAYLGTTDEVDDEGEFYADVLEALRDVASEFDPLTANISGVGRFTIPGDADAFYYSVDAPELPELRQGIVEALEENGLDVSREHGFFPHITAAYLKEGEETPIRRADVKVLNFDALVFFYGDQRVTVKLGGKDPEEADAEFTPDMAGRPGHLDSTAPSAMPGVKGANPFAKNGKGKIGKRGGPPIATGAWVSWGNQRGRVDLVVTNGKVPGVEQDITGSKDKPAARVVVYEQGAGKKWKATGKKVGVSASSLKRSFPLTGGFGKKGLDEDGEAGLVAVLTDYYGVVGDTKEYGVVDPAAVLAVYERGLDSWPGEGAPAPREQWALGRTKAFLAVAAGGAIPGYAADHDLLPDAHPLAVKAAPTATAEVETRPRPAEEKVAVTITEGERIDGETVQATINELLRFARPSA